MRVVLAVGFLIAGRLLSISVPFLYKHAVDALAPGKAIVTVPVALVVAYGAARVMAQGFNELRNAVFAKVTQRAVRRLALSAFRHVHGLALALSSRTAHRRAVAARSSAAPPASSSC